MEKIGALESDRNADIRESQLMEKCRAGIVGVSGLIILALVLFATAGPARAYDVDEQYLLEKAITYDEWFQQWHSPTQDGGFGSAFEVQFTDPSDTQVAYYEGRGDSTIWTGTYLAGEAFRYAVTHDATAKANAIKTVNTLHDHLMVTGIPGYVARFVVPDDVPAYAHGITPTGDCHAGTGGYAGTFWCENTSRDQYTGYWFGNVMAYDLIDDNVMRQQIQEDIRLVYDYFERNDWTIFRPDGKPSTAGPQIGPTMKLDWLLISYHILQDPDIYAEYVKTYEQMTLTPLLGIDTNGLYNRYHDYYGNNLRNQTYFNLFRLETDMTRLRTYLEYYERGDRFFTKGSHNVWLEMIYLTGCTRMNTCRDYGKVRDDILKGMTDFFDPPNRFVSTGPLPQYPPDPLPQIWNSFIDMLGLPPEIADELKLNEQPLYAQEVRFQCHGDFGWQRSPFVSSCPDGDGSFVEPGIDYITPYWMGRYFGLIPPGNPNPDDDTDDDAGPDDNSPPPGGGDVPNPPAASSHHHHGMCG